MIEVEGVERHAALFQHELDVAIFQRAEAMGNQKGGAAACQLVHHIHEIRLGARIQRAGGLVENDERGISEEGSGQGNSLTLTAGETGAPFTDLRL